MNEVTEEAIKSFAFLKSEYGFTGPSICEESWKTSVAFLGETIGIELELDFRDMGVFVLVVRLENGNLPGGYYVSEGKKVRLHLEKFIDVPRHQKRDRPKSREEFISLIRFYAEAVKQGMTRIIQDVNGDIWESVQP